MRLYAKVSHNAANKAMVAAHGVSIEDVVTTLREAEASHATLAHRPRNNEAVEFTKFCKLLWEKHSGNKLPPKRMRPEHPFQNFLDKAMPDELRPARGAKHDWQTTGVNRRSQTENMKVRHRTRLHT